MPAKASPARPASNIGVNALYTSGRCRATGAWQRVRNGPLPLPAGFDRQSAFQFGASTSCRFVRLYGQAGRVRDERRRPTCTSTPATRSARRPDRARLRAGLVRSREGRARPNSSVVRRTFSLGYDYILSKTTDIYAVVMNERLTGLSSANTIAAGVRLRF